ARLAAKLTNWKIDIKSETQFDEYYDNLSEEEQEKLNDLMNQDQEYYEVITYDENAPKGISIEDKEHFEDIYNADDKYSVVKEEI
ncbi:MAG: transcription termination/antitermination protein NusA, partial [Neofamilia sp.]